MDELNANTGPKTAQLKQIGQSFLELSHTADNSFYQYTTDHMCTEVCVLWDQLLTESAIILILHFIIYHQLVGVSTFHKHKT